MSVRLSPEQMIGMDACMHAVLTRLVKSDVPVLADAAEEELDAAVFFDLGFVGFAFADEVFGVAVEDVYL